MGATKIAYKPAAGRDFEHNTRLPGLLYPWPAHDGRRMADSA